MIVHYMCAYPYQWYMYYIWICISIETCVPKNCAPAKLELNSDISLEPRALTCCTYSYFFGLLGRILEIQQATHHNHINTHKTNHVLDTQPWFIFSNPSGLTFCIILALISLLRGASRTEQATHVPVYMNAHTYPKCKWPRSYPKKCVRFIKSYIDQHHANNLIIQIIWSDNIKWFVI